MRHGAWKNGRPDKPQPIVVNNYAAEKTESKPPLITDEEVWLRVYESVRGRSSTSLQAWKELDGDRIAEAADNAVKRFKLRFRK